MRGSLARLLRLAAPLWKEILLAVVLGCATIASGVGLLGLSAYVIALAALRPPIADLQVAIVGLRFLGIARGVFRYLERWVSHNVAFRLLTRLRLWFYQRLEPLAPARLMQYRSGDLLSRIVADVGILEQFFVRILAPPLVAAGTALGLTLFLQRFSSTLALTLLVGLALSGAVVPVLVLRLGRNLGRRSVETRADLTATLVEGVQGCADLIAFGRDSDHLERVRSLSGQSCWLGAQQVNVSGWSSALSGLLMNLTTIAILVAAIPMVSHGGLKGVDLALLVVVAIASFEAVGPLPSALQQLETHLSAAQRLYQIVDSSPAVSEPTTPVGRPRHFDIEVRELSFRYAADSQPALRGVSFRLEEGRRLAVVGQSGAGKSTLIQLLLRFWDYEQGQITLGGRDLKDYRSDDLRQVISVVSQQTHLFNDTIRANLLLARPEATEPDLVRAAMMAQIHEFVLGLPDGYDTWIGEGGLRLSAGERQRLVVARALLKDAPILILDEPTASLDVLTERALLRSLRELMRGRTSLIITHRLSGLEDVDRILVLHRGRIVEQGSHQELLRAGGMYRRMWSLQAEVNAVEALTAVDGSF
jgi:ATP-binding cassette, subfamily C, bacterial CydC